MQPRAKLLTALLASSLLLSGCGSTATTSTESQTSKNSKTGGTLSIALPKQPDTLDPATTGAAVMSSILSWVGNSLIYQDPHTIQFVPGLAKSWHVSANGLTYTFHLRHGVTFSNGTPLNAKAVVAEFQRIMNPKTKAKVAGTLVKPIKTVKTLSTYSFEVILKKPFAPCMTALSQSLLMSVSPTTLKKEEQAFGKKPVITGPWIINHWKSGQSITLSPNTKYHWAPSFFKNQGRPYPNHLKLQFITNPSTLDAALLSGQVDIGGIDTTALSQFRSIQSV